MWRGFTQIKGPGAPGITGSRRGQGGQGTRLWFQDGKSRMLDEKMKIGHDWERHFMTFSHLIKI